MLIGGNGWYHSVDSIQGPKGPRANKRNMLSKPGTLRAAVVQARPPACQGRASNAGDCGPMAAYVKGLSAMPGGLETFQSLNKMLPLCCLYNSNKFRKAK